MHIGPGARDDTFMGSDLDERVFADSPSKPWSAGPSGSQRDVISTGGAAEGV